MTVFVPRADADDRFVTALRGAGFDVAHAALTRTVDLAARVPALASVDWLVVTSARTVARLDWAQPLGCRLAALGRGTRAALPDDITPDLLPTDESGAGLLAELGPLLAPGQTVLLPGSARSDPSLAHGLRAAGAAVLVVPLYDTLPVSQPPAVLLDAWAELDAIVLLASSQARALASFAPDRTPALVALGRPTARTCAELGWAVAAVAQAPTPTAVVSAVSATVAG